MHFHRLVLLILMLVGALAHAQDEADIQAFNEAWRSYEAAMQTSQIELQIEFSQIALDAAGSIFEPTDERLVLLTLNNGRALINGNRDSEARVVLQRCRELAVDIYGKKSVKLVPILSSLAETYDEYLDNDKQRYYRQAKNILRGESGNDSETYATFLLKAGADIYSTSDVSASKSYFKRAHEIFQETGGASNLQTGIAAFYLGKVEFSNRRFKSSTEHLLNALVAFRGGNEEGIQFELHTRALLVQLYERRGDSDLATEHCVAIGRVSSLRANQNYQPLFRMVPSYPGAMLSRGAEGFVDIAFTVDESGFTKDPEVIQSGSGDRGFEKAAIEAVKRFRYAPRFEDGEAVAVENIKTRITFALSR